MKTRPIALSRPLMLPVILSVAIATMAMMCARDRARADDKGQWNAYHLSDDQKAWFKTVLVF